jgi:hypothetical protein
MAHNPEVAGSNPAPATKARGPFSNRERAFCMRSANGYVNVGLAQAAPRSLRRACAQVIICELDGDGMPMIS